MKKIKIICLVLVMALFTTGCNIFSPQSDRVSRNVSQEADNFNVIRRLTVINLRSDKPLFELVAAFSITVDTEQNQLEIICETGKNEYKKHFVSLNEWTSYVIEDVSGAKVSKYHYEVNFQPKAILPAEVTLKD